MYEIKNWREFTGEGKLKGFFTVVIGDFEINDMKLLTGDYGDFIRFPSKPYEDKDGEKKYSYTVYMPDEERRKSFNSWCLKELDSVVGIEPSTKEEDSKIPF